MVEAWRPIPYHVDVNANESIVVSSVSSNKYNEIMNVIYFANLFYSRQCLRNHHPYT